MNVYPINLIVHGKTCLVVGGGRIAARKAGTLLSAGAHVKVVSPEISPGLAELAMNDALVVYARPYCHEDIEGCFLVICATDDSQLNQTVAEEAQSRNILVNVVDNPNKGNFTIPAQLIRKDLLLTIATNGRSPAFAKMMREDLAARYGPEYGEYLDFFAKARTIMQQTVSSSCERNRLWQILSKELLILLQAGKYQEAEEKMMHAIGSIRSQS